MGPKNKTIKIKVIKCLNCGLPIGEHYAVNFSDGEFVSGTVPICPTAMFREKKKEYSKTK